MNIDEYRAMKAEIESQTEVVDNAQVEQEPTQTAEQTVPQTEQTPVQTQQEAVIETTTEPVQSQPEAESELERYKAEIEALRKQTQALTNQVQSTSVAQQYYDKMMSDPGYAQVFAEKNGLPYVDPQQQAVLEVERKYNDLLLEREIENMKLKYSDFNPQEVIKVAVDKGLNSLEDAYIIAKSVSPSKEAPINAETLKEQIRQEILKELESNVDTGSLIGTPSGGTKLVQDNLPKLSSKEIEIAKNFGMSPAEYSKWRDKK